MEVAYNHKLNLAILEKTMPKEVWHKMFFGGYVALPGEVSMKNGQEYLNPNGSPIRYYKNFKEEGRDNLLVPFLNRLTGAPVFGDTQVKGTGEEQSVRYHRAYINQWRKAVMKLSGRMSNQRVKSFQFDAKAEQQLMQWYSEWYNAMIIQAIYNGSSKNLYAGTNDDGLGLKYRFHPNMYTVAGTTGDTLTKIAGTEGQSPTAADITTAVHTGYASVDKMTGKTLRAIALWAIQHRIEQMTTEDGYKFWPLIVAPEVFYNLRADSDVYRGQDAAYNSKLMQHPAINGRQMMHYEGVAIVMDMLVPRPWDNSILNFAGATTVDAQGRATDPWLQPGTYSGQASATTYKNYANVLLGADAL